MSAYLSTGVFVVTAILIVLLVAGRFAIRLYGKRIGVDEMDFDSRPELSGQRSRYNTLKKIYGVANFAVGIWIFILGVWVIQGAWTALSEARRLGYSLGPSRTAGALGAAGVLAAIGVLLLPQILRWDLQPERILDPRPAYVPPAASSSPSRSGADFTALIEAAGDPERPRPIVRWYNARPVVLWGMVILTVLMLLCYFMVFLANIPIG